METFSALLAICAGNSPVTGEFPKQRPVMRSFGVFFDLRLNKRLSKQQRRRWFETPSRSLWRHCNEYGWLHTLSNKPGTIKPGNTWNVNCVAKMSTLLSKCQLWHKYSPHGVYAHEQMLKLLWKVSLGLRWRHDTETFSTLLVLCEGIHCSPMDSLIKGQ